MNNKPFLASKRDDYRPKYQPGRQTLEAFRDLAGVRSLLSFGKLAHACSPPGAGRWAVRGRDVRRARSGLDLAMLIEAWMADRETMADECHEALLDAVRDEMARADVMEGFEATQRMLHVAGVFGIDYVRAAELCEEAGWR